MVQYHPTQTGRFIPVQCDCGSARLVKLTKLLSGSTISCGCAKVDRFTAHATKHGGRYMPEYQVWLAMHQRCSNLKNRSYHNYGERGIKVCKRWAKFENFIADMGVRPFEGATLERTNNDKGYSPSNCVWATRKEQSQNSRRWPKKELS